LDARVEHASPLVSPSKNWLHEHVAQAELCLKKVMIAVAAVCMLGLTCSRAQVADRYGMLGDDMRLCLAPDQFLSETSNPPPIRLEGLPLRRLFANYSRFYRGPQAEVDLVLAYERGEVVLLVPFAEGCAASQER
jgi:hypothetical protein